MADEETTPEVDEEEFEGEAGEEDEDDEVDAGPDPFEGLEALADETELQAERIRTTAEQLQEKLRASQEAVRATKDPETGQLGAVPTAILALLDAKLFMLDELAETLMPFVDSVTRSARDNISELREDVSELGSWAEEEVEPVISQLTGEPPQGAPTGSVLLPNDGAAVDELLAELHGLLTQGLSGFPEGSEQYQGVQTRLGQIAQIRAYVQKITLPDEPTPSP